MDYWPDIVQVIPTEDYEIYLYFDDGTIRLFDASNIFEWEGQFKLLKDKKIFMETCTVINNTLAWTLDRTYSEETCLDVDPLLLYNTCPIVEEPMHLFDLDLE